MELVIMRGVSGSGKSTKAAELVKEFLESNPNGTIFICSADNFFKDLETKEYKFDPQKLGQAHSWCKGQAQAACELGIDLVVIDNTNTQRWEFEPYLKLAKAFGYNAQEVVVGDLDEDSLQLYASRNSHGVPLEAIKRMAKRFE